MPEIYFETLLSIVRKAGERIIEIYNDPEFSKIVDFKSDNSPLTLADEASHRVIKQELTENYPDLSILSEEDEMEIEYVTRKEWDAYWLVDPLDGTKEFINRNGEFTVNIALIKLGMIYVPVQDTFYYGDRERGAFMKEGSNEARKIFVNNNKNDLIAVRSKSHASEEENEVLERYGVADFISVGSSLKFCMVAEGKADIYYRHGPTMEWDTAAGQAIVEAAGGKVYKGNQTLQMFTYNKEDLLNGSFLCVGFDH